MVQPVSSPKFKKAKRKSLENAGWKIGSVSEFLELTPEESALIEIRLASSQTVNIDIANAIGQISR